MEQKRNLMKLNTIYLGDAYELIKQIPNKSIDCIYTDIPYLIVSGGGGIVNYHSVS